MKNNPLIEGVSNEDRSHASENESNSRCASHISSEPVGLARPDNYQQIPNSLFKDVIGKKLKTIDVLVYAAFNSRLGKNTSAWPSNNTIAKEIGKCVRAVQKSLQRLQGAGHIARIRKTAWGTFQTELLTLVEEGKVKHKPKPSLKPRHISPEEKALTQKTEVGVKIITDEVSKPVIEQATKAHSLITETVEERLEAQKRDESYADKFFDEESKNEPGKNHNGESVKTEDLTLEDLENLDGGEIGSEADNQSLEDSVEDDFLEQDSYESDDEGLDF